MEGPAAKRRVLQQDLGYCLSWSETQRCPFAGPLQQKRERNLRPFSKKLSLGSKVFGLYPFSLKQVEKEIAGETSSDASVEIIMVPVIG